VLQLRRLLILAIRESRNHLGSALGERNSLEGSLLASSFNSFLGAVDVEFDVLVEGGVELDLDCDVGGSAGGEVYGGEVFGDGDLGAGRHVGWLFCGLWVVSSGGGGE
jgi:hypothetical protein